eukprot:COSAG01_NODE_1002_length_12208_cov_63.234701_5_plen_59_part_00
MSRIDQLLLEIHLSLWTKRSPVSEDVRRFTRRYTLSSKLCRLLCATNLASDRLSTGRR